MENWDPELYAALFPFPGMGTWDTELYTALALAAGGPVLELASGTSRILLALLRADIEAFGLELSAGMVAIGRAALGTAGIPDPEARVDLADMTSFEHPRKYRLIALPDNSMSVLHDDEQVLCMLERVVAHLDQGGEFVFDQSLLDRGPHTEQWADRVVTLGGEQVTVHTRGEYDPDTQMFRLFLDVEGRSRSMVLTLRQRSPQQLTRLMTQAGFGGLCPPIDETGHPVHAASRMYIGRFAVT